jgi:ESS family glutamate:Na+ symporter
VRRGWTRSGTAQVKLISGLEQRNDPSPAAFARVRGEVIDPLAFQVLMVAMAFLVGLGLQWGFRHVAAPLAPEAALPYLERLPLFLFTLLGGWIVRWGLTVLALDDLLDGASIKRIVAIAMEYLIVAAIASLRIEVVAAYFWPVALLCVLGFAWTAVCVLVLARRLLPAGYWFELGIINYGMSTGTTAQGIMLLRIVDRDLDSGAAEDYALAAPLSAPFIGGGVITMSLPLVLTKVATPMVVAVAVLAMIGLFLAGRHLQRTAPAS